MIEDNPKLRDSIFEHLEELGVEDPERYVVGSGANSINPDTGLPEFFFKKIARALKKTVKKVSRAVKKVSKSVVKVVKKVAPIVLPIALSFTPLGAIYGAALGSGIGTLIQGGSLKDAFKSALISGATGAVFKGLTGKGTFMENVSKAAANPMGRLSQTASGLGSTLRGGGFTGGGNLFSDFVPTPSAMDPASVPPPDMISTTASDQLAADTATGQLPDLQLASADGLPPGTEIPTTNVPVGQSEAGQYLQNQAKAAELASSKFVSPPEPPSFFESLSKGNIKDAFLPSRGTSFEEVLQMNNINPMQATAEQISVAKEIAAKSAPGLTGYLPLAGAGVGAVALAGGFTPKEDPPQEEMQTGADLIELDPDKYRLPEETPQYAQGPTTVGTNYGIDPRTGRPYVNPFLRPSYGLPVLAVAEGGEIFPRRVGGIMPDEGTPGKDSVRAMLMPGEFVMTTNAVKGLGDGDNDKGINRMYDMMRGLEAKGRAMA